MASRTQVRFQMVSGSFPAGNESGYAPRAITGMTETNHGSLKDTLGFLAASIQRIHGSSDWTNSAAGIFSHDIKPATNNARVLGANIASSFGSSLSMSGITLGSGSKILRFSTISSTILDEAASGDFLAVGDYRATLAAVPSTTVTFASSFGSSLDVSGVTLGSGTSAISFVSESALQSALGTDIRAGDVLVIGDATFAIGTAYSGSGASLSVTHTSGTQSGSAVSGGTTCTLSAAGTSGSPGGISLTYVAGSQGSISGGTASAIVRGYSMIRAANLEMNGAGRIDLDIDQDTSIRASADDVITIEVAGADKLDITSTAIHPETDALMDLGTSAIGFNDLHLGSGGVVNFDGGDVTMTHSSNLLEVAGGSLRADKLELDANNHIDVDGSSDLVMTSAAALKLDSAADIVLSADGDQVIFDDGSTSQMHIDWSGSGEVAIQSLVNDDDIKLKGKSAGNDVTALTLDMSDSGRATFANDVRVGVDVEVLGDLKLGAGADEFVISESSDNITMNVAQADKSLTISGVDGSSSINALVLDMASAGKATFSGDLVVGGNVIRASDGGATITMDTSDNVTVAGDLTVSGNDIAFASGAANIGAAIGSANMTLGGSSSTVVIPGNLTVSGTTTQVDTTNMNVKDANILINDGGSTSTSPGAGLNIEEGGSVTGYMRVADDDRTNLDLKAPGGSELKLDVNSGSTFTIAGNLGVEAASLINQDLTTDSATAELATLTLSTSLVAKTQDGAALGSSSLQFSDLYLADGAQILLGDDGDVSLTHVADTGVLLNSTMAVQFADANSSISNPGAGLKLADHAVIEVEAATSIQMDSPIVDFEDDGVVLQFGDGDDVTLTHVHDSGLLLGGSKELQFGNAAQKISGANSSSGALTLAAGGNVVLSPGSSGAVVADADDGAALGSTSVKWSDLFLADGAVINYGAGGQTLTHSTGATLGSDIKSTHGPNFRSSNQSYTTSLSSLAFQSYGSDISSSHAGNIVGSTISSSASSLEFGSSSQASAFGSALGGGGTVARFDDGAGGIYDIEFSSYGSGVTIGIVGITQVTDNSSLSVSGLQGSGTIKVVSTSGTDVNTAASAFNSALPSSRIVRFDDNNANVIDYTFSSYSSGGSISIASATQVSGGTVSKTAISSSSAGGSIKGVTALTDTLTVSDTLTLSEHDGSSLGLTLGSTLVTATGTELNLLDGGTSASSVTLTGNDGFIINDGGTMKLALISDMAAFFSSNRTKKSTTVGASGIAAGAVTTVSGMVHDLGADPDVTDVYLNGQLMLSGSSASAGDYRINGVGAESTFSSAPSISNSGLTSSTTSLTFGSAYGGSTVSSGTVIVLLNSAGTKRFEGTLSADLTNGASSASVSGARSFVPSTGAAITGTDFPGSEVNGSSCKTAAALTTDDVVFHFALEGDDVVTITKNG